MAANDKLYVRSYYDYCNIRKWATVYFPKLLIFMRDWSEEDALRCVDKGYNIAVFNTPLHIDRALRWRCPIPEVREYLHKQCGYNPRWEWLYRPFWRGKRFFLDK